MLNSDEHEVRDNLLVIHRRLMEQYDLYKKIEVEDENFKLLIDAILAFIEQVGILVVEVATNHLPVELSGGK